MDEANGTVVGDLFGPSFLGIRMMFAELSQCRLLVWRFGNWLMTAMMSTLIVFQQVLNKALE
jgi:hypothetical protein